MKLDRLHGASPVRGSGPRGNHRKVRRGACLSESDISISSICDLSPPGLAAAPGSCRACRTGDAVDALVPSREMRRGRESRRHRHLDHRPVGIEQQLAGPLDPHLHVVAQRRHAGMPQEEPLELPCAHPDPAGDIRQRHAGFRCAPRMVAMACRTLAGMKPSVSSRPPRWSSASSRMRSWWNWLATPRARSFRAARRSDGASCPSPPCRPSRSAGRGRSRRSCWCSRVRGNLPGRRTGSPSGWCSGSPEQAGRAPADRFPSTASRCGCSRRAACRRIAR